MDRNEILEKVKKVIDYTMNSSLEMAEDTKFVDLQMDSLDLFEMVMELEERFDIHIENSDLEKFLNIRDVVDCLVKLT